jgi:histone-lysine N-methyltransferase SETD1
MVQGHRLVITIRPAVSKKPDIPIVDKAATAWRNLPLAKKPPVTKTKTKPPTPESLKRSRRSYSSSEDEKDVPSQRRSRSVTSDSSLSEDDVPLGRKPAKPLPSDTPVSQVATPLADEPMPLAADQVKKGKKRVAKPKADKAAKKARLEDPVVEVLAPVEPAVAEIKLDDVVKPTKPAKPVKPRKPAKTELDKFLESGVVQDEEDAYWLGQALAATHEGAEPDLSDEEDKEEDELALKEGHPLYHTAGSWRAEGWKKIPQMTKVEYLPERNRAAVSKEDASALASGRTARVTGRRLAHDMESTRKTASAATAESDLFAFNQLRIRKKQLRFSRSPIEGYGLYAMETIHPGEMVCEYVGEICRSAVAEIREQRYLKQGIGSSYLFRIDNDMVCDATFKGSVR